MDYFTALQVEIDVAGEESIEVMESGLEEVVDEAKSTQAAASDDSALALLADITSKYQQEEPTIQVIKKENTCKGYIKFCGYNYILCEINSYNLFVLNRMFCMRRRL